MFSPALVQRLDALIDDLILDGGVETASLASILLTAKDSASQHALASLARKVWEANNEIRGENGWVPDEDELTPHAVNPSDN